MDRGAFLHSLEFLSPISSSENTTTTWPPRTNGACETNVIVKNHLLSVEPRDVGPAFFESEHGLDPAMFHLNICIVKTVIDDAGAALGGNHNKLTSPATSSVSTSLSVSQSPPKDPSLQDEAREKATIERIHVLFQMDHKHVFQTNLAMFRGLHLEEEPSTGGGVPNLQICFDSCTLRIFSEEALKDVDSYRDFDTLKTAASLLRQAASTFQRMAIFQGEHHPMTLLYNTESTGTTRSSGSDSHGQHDKDTSSENGRSPEEPVSIMRGMKRKHSALARSWNGLHSLRTVLDMPQNTTIAADDGSITEAIGPILTMSAEELATSYCRQKDVRKAVQSCSDVISSCEAQLNDVFTAGFPPPRNRRSRSSPTKMTPTTPVAAEENMDSLLETAHSLLQKQKDAFQQRLELSLLPIRE